MTAESLYAELKPDISVVANALFDVSELFLRKQGNFLPHGAILTIDGEVRMVAAAPDTPDGNARSADVLPLLHEGLRRQVLQQSANAIGVAENVTVALDGKPPTKAIKVLFEHKRGLCVALYLPFEKKLLHGYVMGLPVSLEAAPEVRAWGSDAA